MISWLVNKYQDWKFEKEFQKKKEELIKHDPFIYEIPEEEKSNTYIEHHPEKF